MRLHELDRTSSMTWRIVAKSSLSKVFEEEKPCLFQTSVNFLLHIIQFLRISFSQKFHKSMKIQVNLPNRHINSTQSKRKNNYREREREREQGLSQHTAAPDLSSTLKYLTEIKSRAKFETKKKRSTNVAIKQSEFGNNMHWLIRTEETAMALVQWEIPLDRRRRKLKSSWVYSNPDRVNAASRNPQLQRTNPIRTTPKFFSSIFLFI